MLLYLDLFLICLYVCVHARVRVQKNILRGVSFFSQAIQPLAIDCPPGAV